MVPRLPGTKAKKMAQNLCFILAFIYAFKKIHFPTNLIFICVIISKIFQIWASLLFLREKSNTIITAL